MMLGPGESDPSQSAGGGAPARGAASPPNQVTFNRRELNRILDLYGRKVAAGEWRDYAIDFLKDRAVFSVFRRASEVPLYRIEKNPKLQISCRGLAVARGDHAGGAEAGRVVSPAASSKCITATVPIARNATPQTHIRPRRIVGAAACRSPIPPTPIRPLIS